MSKLTILLLTGMALSLSSCATVFGRWGNSLKFENEAGETAEVFLDGKKIGHAPGKIKLNARLIQQGSRLELRSEENAVRKYIILRRVDAGYTLLNIVATAGVGMAVDFGTGYIYRPAPRKFTYAFPEDQQPEKNN